jgi:HlyD family secretion protein
MNKPILIALVLALAAGGAFAVFSRRQDNRFTAAAQSDVETMVPVTAGWGSVIAEARVVPARHAALSMPISGIVDEVPVAENDHVLAGQVLLRLQNGREQAGVAKAEAALRSAQARLAEMQAGARSQELAASQAELDTAQAELDLLREDPRSEDLAAAEASLAEADASLADVMEGPGKDEVTEALANRANAQAELQRAQAAYDGVKWDPAIQSRPESVQLQQATNNHEVASAHSEELIKGASKAEISAAEAGVWKAKAELDRVKSPATASEIASAAAKVRKARAELELLQAGTRPEQIEQAEADVRAAEADLQQARIALTETELRAPFKGIVASLDVRTGEPVEMGKMVARLADVSTWLIETDDLTEIEVVHVWESAPATITFDAIPELELSGTVVRVKPYGEEKRGDMTYTALVEPEQHDDRLRWNMTAVVSIDATSGPE